MRQKNTTPNQYTVDPNSTNLVNSGSGSGWGSGATSSLPVEDDGNDGVIENSGGTFMLIHVDFGVMGAAAPTLTQALSWDGNGELILPAGWSVVDAGIHSEFGEAANGRLFADVNFGPEPATNIPAGAEYVVTNFEIEYIGRWGDSTGQTSADWHASNLTDNVLSGSRRSLEANGFFVTQDLKFLRVPPPLHKLPSHSGGQSPATRLPAIFLRPARRDFGGSDKQLLFFRTNRRVGDLRPSGGMDVPGDRSP